MNQTHCSRPLMRATLPLVCKRWRDAIYSAKGDFDLMHGIMMLGSSIYSYIRVTFDEEYASVSKGQCPSERKERVPSLLAVARWIHKNIERGNIKYPLDFTATARHNTITHDSRSEQELAPLLAVMGAQLEALQVIGTTGLLQGFDFSKFGTVPNLRRLHLKRVQHRLCHEEVQEGLASLKNLWILHISVDEGYEGIAGLSTFPTALCSLPRLQYLTLWGHRLSRLPQAMSQLTNLAGLSICNGSIEHVEGGHLPSVLGHLAQLKSLALPCCSGVMDRSGAGAIRDMFQWCSMTELTSLGLHGDYGPSEVAKLTGLELLSLQRFTDLKDQPQLSALRNLTRITVRRSTVKKLPAWMGGLPKLSFLELDEVQLQVWSLSKFTALQDAHFWDCNATKVTDSIGQLTGLTSLIFARCPLEELSSSVSRLQNLRELKLEGSFFPEFPSALHALRARQLQSVDLTASLGWQKTLRPRRVISQGKDYAAMPVHAEDLEWLLHHPCLKEVAITITQAEATALQGLREELAGVLGRNTLNFDVCG